MQVDMSEQIKLKNLPIQELSQPIINKNNVIESDQELLLEYKNKVHGIFLDQQKIKNNLRLNGFIQATKFCEYSSAIHKVTSNSILYKVQCGNLISDIYVFISALQLNIPRQTIGEGGYARAEYFQVGNQKIVAKKWFRSSENLFVEEIHLREVFMTKLASALGIGPKFYNTYGYDIIMLKDTCEMLMECCDNYVPLLLDVPTKQSCFENNLVQNLVIIHSYHFMHCDIKPDNIGWSYLQQKFVFLDFGLSLIIEEELGAKTFVSFRGTHQYASKEMQKLMILARNYVDLYYNDLHSMNKTIRQIQKQNQFKAKHENFLPLKTSNWYKYLNYFKFEFFIFTQDYNQLSELVRQEDGLLLSFMLILKERQEKLLYIDEITLKFERVYGGKSIEQILELNTADSYLYTQLNLAKNIGQISCVPSLKNIQVLCKRKRINKLWGQPLWTERFFQILYIEQDIVIEQKKVLIQSVHQELHKDSQAYNFSQIYYEVLRGFEQYFVELSNFRKLFHIKYIYELCFMLNDTQRLGKRIILMLVADGSITSLLIGLQHILVEQIYNLNMMILRRICFYLIDEQNLQEMQISKIAKNFLEILKNLEVAQLGSDIKILKQKICSFAYPLENQADRRLYEKNVELIDLYSSSHQYPSLLSQSLDQPQKYLLDIIHEEQFVPIRDIFYLKFQFSRKLRQVHQFVQMHPILAYYSSLWSSIGSERFVHLSIVNEYFSRSSGQEYWYYYFSNFQLNYLFFNKSLKPFISFVKKLKVKDLRKNKKGYWERMVHIIQIVLLPNLFLFGRPDLVKSEDSKQQIWDVLMGLVTQLKQGEENQRQLKLFKILELFYNIRRQNYKNVIPDPTLHSTLVDLIKEVVQDKQFKFAYTLIYDLMGQIYPRNPGKYQPIEQVTIERFQRVTCTQDAMLISQSGSLGRLIVNKLLKDEQFEKLQFFFYSYSLSLLHYGSGNIFYYNQNTLQLIYSKIPVQYLESFEHQILSQTQMKSISKNYILIFILYFLIHKLKSTLSQKQMRRYINMLVHGYCTTFTNISNPVKSLVKKKLVEWAMSRQAKQRKVMINYRRQLRTLNPKYKLCTKMMYEKYSRKKDDNHSNYYKSIMRYFKDKMHEIRRIDSQKVS